MTAVWDDVLGWLRGDALQVTATPSADIALMVSQLATGDTEGEARRMGCAYLTGREAGGGSAAALAALVSAIRSDRPSLQRCGIW